MTIAVAVGTTIADRLQIRTSALRIRLLPWMSGGECLLHTVQSLGDAFTARCRAHARSSDVLLRLRPSLPGRAAQDDAGPDGEREVRR
jgi:predicted hotdog family 3-hydroxylacyl-ACP dehydratase